MPAHNLYNTLIDIWSRGCNPVLHYSLPILFAYEVSSFILASLGIHRRCHYAITRAEAETRAATERIESAVALEKKKRAEERARFVAMMEKERSGRTETGEEIEKQESRESGESRSRDGDSEEDRRDIESLVEEDRRRMSSIPAHRFGPSFGPSFGMGLTSGGAGDDGNGADLGRSSTLPSRLFKRKGSMA